MMSMPPIAVLAGGLARRMRPHTETIPKSMLVLAGEPFVAHQLRLFRRQGIERVVLCIGHLGNVIQDFVGDGRRFGIEVTYSADGEQPLGTGGALRKALQLLPDEFLVIYGDSYLDMPFGALVAAYRRSRLPAFMTVLHNTGRWDTSNVEFVNGRILAYCKDPTPQMRHIDHGLALLHSRVFAITDKTCFDLGDLYTKLVQRAELGGYEVDSRFYEIGSPRGLADTDAYLRAKVGKQHP
jgi:NDP-sugar pyrophosphorylase family protein